MSVTHLFTYKKILFSVAIAVIAILYRSELKTYLYKYSSEDKLKTGIYSEQQLAKYNGVTKKKLYLAILGTIFDVTNGKKYYQKGSEYHYFVGKDGSRAFVTGNFKDESNDKDHIIDLSCKDLFILLNWRKTLKQKYIEVGVLKGRYFNDDGEETAYLKEIMNKIKECEIEKENAKKEDLKYPPCNIAWSEEEGTKVWCTTSSGGIQRSWAGVPRQLYSPGVDKPRCICLNVNTEADSSGLVKEYENCANTSTTCLVKT